MCKFFKIKKLDFNIPENIYKYCMNNIIENILLPNTTSELIFGRGVGGDIDWGVHKWDEYSKQDYGLDYYDGYRFYVGEREHGLNVNHDLDCYKSEQEVHEALKHAVEWYKKQHQENARELDKMMQDVGLV